uniref:Catenin (Cadherin-associated protein), delta 1 n=1 Tax=Nothobranchius furzeri TaxID=105023 RepID=A0A1A7ZCY0_NOTFU
MEQCASTASLLASVREQERQFELLSRALEEERRSCAGTLPRPLPNMQNGRVLCDADIERLTLNEGYVNGTYHFRMEPGHLVHESCTVEEQPQEPPFVSVDTREDGTTRHTETNVKKVIKTTTTRTVIPSISDTLSMDGGGSVTGVGPYRQVPGVGVPMDYPTHTVPRNYHYGPPAGYDNYRSGPPSEMYTSLNRGARMDDAYRPVHPDGYRTLDPSYRAPSRNQLDPYAAQPQVGRSEMSTIQRFVPDPYGLEDDQRSIGFDEPDYGMSNPVHYSTVPRNHGGFPQGPPRRTGSYEGLLDSGGDMYYWNRGAPLAQGERGSMASLDSTLRKGAPPGGWRQPELPEVIAMLNYRLDPVRSNAAAYLQHLTYKNDKVKTDVRRMKGIPALVEMLDNPNREKGEDPSQDQVDIPVRSTPAKGYELLFQPEVVHVYLSLLKEAKNPHVLEASAGAIQNLCAGNWTYGRCIRGLVRKEKGLSMITELLNHENDRVVRAMSGALRNLALDARNRELEGQHSVAQLVANLPGGGQSQPVRALSEETVVSILSTLHEVLGTNIDAARIFRTSQGVERLVLIHKDGNRSEREVRGAVLILKTLWAHKEIRRALQKDGWKKEDILVEVKPVDNSNRPLGGYEESTLPLIDKGNKGDRDMIPMNDMGPDAYTTLDRNNTHESSDKDSVQGGMYGERQASLPLMDSYDG